MPFSDPMADGPVIQRASERALAQGVSLLDVLGARTQVPRARRDDADRAHGVREPDRGDGCHALRGARAGCRRGRRARRRLSARGSGDVRGGARARAASRRSSCCRRRRPSRASREVARLARGYVYYVSLKGVTGAGHLDTDDVARKLAQIRRHVQHSGRRRLRHSRRGRAHARSPRMPTRSSSAAASSRRSRPGAPGGSRAARRRVAWYHSHRDRRGYRRTRRMMIGRRRARR